METRKEGRTAAAGKSELLHYHDYSVRWQIARAELLEQVIAREEVMAQLGP